MCELAFFFTPGKMLLRMRRSTTSDDYDVDHRTILGRGRYSTVKPAFCRRHQRHVAAKITPILRENDDAFDNISREFHILFKLDHVNIIDVYDHFVDGDCFWITMERAQNGDLRKFVHLRRRLSENLACKFFAQILDGVSYMHNQEIVHRDIKCENILVTGNEEIIKICDMGCAVFVHEHENNQSLRNDNQPTRHRELFYGSPAYAAPEVLDRMAYEIKPTDVWSSGVVLFFMVSGYLPFGCDDVGKIRARMNTSLRWPRPIKQIGKCCRDYVKSILELRPDDRLTAEGALHESWIEKE